VGLHSGVGEVSGEVAKSGGRTKESSREARWIIGSHGADVAGGSGVGSPLCGGG
jgi:hypothetical protein